MYVYMVAEVLVVRWDNFNFPLLLPPSPPPLH